MDNHEHLLEKVRKLHLAGAYQAVIDVLEDTLLERLADAELYFYRGDSWHHEQDLDKAFADYDKAIAIAPDCILAYFNRGIAWYDKEEYDLSIREYSKVVEMDPNLAAAYCNRGLAWARKKEYEKAITDFDRSIELNPDFRVYFNRGNAWHKKGEHERAIKDYSKTIELNAGFIKAYRFRGFSWYDKGGYDQTIKDLTRAIELDPDDATSYTTRGNAWMKKREFDKAIEDYSKAIELDPGHASPYCYRGIVRIYKAEYGKVKEDLDKALELDPSFGTAYFGWGMFYEATEGLHIAAAYYKRGFCFDFDDHIKMVEVFGRKVPSPYILKEVFAGINTKEELERHISTIGHVANSCKIWDSYLGYLRAKKYHETLPEKFYSLEAIVNFYMGNSVRAYKIYDNRFESEDHPYPLSRRDQYYLALSAHDFLEQDDGLSFATGQPETGEDNDNINRYYIGRLFYLSNDWDAALHHFEKCENFLPALYAKTAIYQKQGKHDELLRTAKMIEAIEENPDNEMAFSDGTESQLIQAGASFEGSFSNIMNRLFYYELLEEIKEVRGLLRKPAVYKHVEFAELLRFEVLFADEMVMAPAIEELRKNEDELADRIKDNLKEFSKEDLEQEIYNNTDAGDEFTAIRRWIDNKPAGQTIEEVLALRIYKPSLSLEWYNKFTIYYFLEGAFDAKTLLRLFLYGLHVNLTNFDSLPETYKRIISLINDLFRILKKPVGLMYTTLTDLLAVFHLDLKKESFLDESLDYKYFREHYYEYLGFYQNTLTTFSVRSSPLLETLTK